MTTEGIPRVPQGVPSGGQFTQTTHAESPVRLFDRSDGTFFRPSPSSTADHCIGFWSQVEIPDEIITQVENVYAKVRSDEIDQQMEQRMQIWMEQFQAENPPPKREGRKLDEYHQMFREEHEKYRLSILDGVVNERPERLGSYDSRQLIRSAQMLLHRPNPAKFNGESDKVLQHSIELYDEVLTVEQIERKYRLSEIEYAMTEVFQHDSNAAIVEALNTVDNRLAGINDQLVAHRAENSGY